MLEAFPNLEKEQVALSRADVNTGIVLDEQHNRAISPIQKIYTVFNDELTALRKAEILIIENPNIECYIYKASDKLLYFLNSEGIKKF